MHLIQCLVLAAIVLWFVILMKMHKIVNVCILASVVGVGVAMVIDSCIIVCNKIVGTVLSIVLVGLSGHILRLDDNLYSFKLWPWFSVRGAVFVHVHATL